MSEHRKEEIVILVPVAMGAIVAWWTKDAGLAFSVTIALFLILSLAIYGLS